MTGNNFEYEGENLYVTRSGYTGEDGFEVYAHGGLAVMSKIVEAFAALGFQEAGPGEFSKKGFS